MASFETDLCWAGGGRGFFLRSLHGSGVKIYVDKNPPPRYPHGPWDGPKPTAHVAVSHRGIRVFSLHSFLLQS